MCVYSDGIKSQVKLQTDNPFVLAILVATKAAEAPIIPRRAKLMYVLTLK